MRQSGEVREDSDAASGRRERGSIIAIRLIVRMALMLGAHLGSFEILRVMGTFNQIEVAMMMDEDNARMVNTVAKAAAATATICISRSFLNATQWTVQDALPSR